MKATCRICDRHDTHEVFQAREMMYGSREEFQYFQCGACQTLQIATVPGDLGRHYPTAYYSLARVAEAGLAPAVLNRVLGLREPAYVAKHSLLRAVFERVKPPVEHSRLVLESLRAAGAQRHWRILDVGCGGGAILHRLRTGGFRGVAGVDPFIPETLVYRNGLEITKGELASVATGWDLITFHHSLEHVPDPISALTEARRKLTPRGHVLVRIPTVSSLAWERFGVNWVQLDAPRHLFLLSRDGLDIAARAAGLRRVWSYDDSTALQFTGSESYARGGAPIDFSPAELAAFRREAQRANAANRGDQIVVLLANAHG